MQSHTFDVQFTKLMSTFTDVLKTAVTYPVFTYTGVTNCDCTLCNQVNLSHKYWHHMYNNHIHRYPVHIHLFLKCCSHIHCRHADQDTHLLFMTISYNKLGLSWAKLSQSWDLKFGFEVVDKVKVWRCWLMFEDKVNVDI